MAEQAAPTRYRIAVTQPRATPMITAMMRPITAMTTYWRFREGPGPPLVGGAVSALPSFPGGRPRPNKGRGAPERKGAGPPPHPRRQLTSLQFHPPVPFFL